MRKQSKPGPRTSRRPPRAGGEPQLHGVGASSLDRVTSLAVFARVVERRSFSGAARAIGATTSAVSKRVARLEDSLGVRLLHRTTRRLSLTDAGTTLYEHAFRIVAEVEVAELAVLRLGSEARGLLRLSASVVFGERHVAPLLGEFLERYPEVHVDVSFSDRYVDLVEERYDMAVRIGRLVDSSLIARKLGESATLIVASPAYLRKHGAPRAPGDLLRHECLRYTYSADEWPTLEGGAPLQVRGRIRLNSGAAVCAAAEAGAGLAVLPFFIADDALRAGRLRAVLPEVPLPRLGIYAVSPPGRAPLPTVRAFTAFLAERLPARLAGSSASEPRSMRSPAR